MDEYSDDDMCHGEYDGCYCDNKITNTCEICDKKQCNECWLESKSCNLPSSDIHCGNCINMLQTMKDAEQKEDQCYYGGCIINPNDKCTLCDRNMCDTHKEKSYCGRCTKEIQSLTKKLKENDSYQKEELIRAKELNEEDYKFYLYVRSVSSASSFWDIKMQVELEKKYK